MHQTKWHFNYGTNENDGVLWANCRIYICKLNFIITQSAFPSDIMCVHICILVIYVKILIKLYSFLKILVFTYILTYYHKFKNNWIIARIGISWLTLYSYIMFQNTDFYIKNEIRLLWSVVLFWSQMRKPLHCNAY